LVWSGLSFIFERKTNQTTPFSLTNLKAPLSIDAAAPPERRKDERTSTEDHLKGNPSKSVTWPKANIKKKHFSSD